MTWFSYFRSWTSRAALGLALGSCLLVPILSTGCASGPSSSNPTTQQPDATPALLRFTLRVNPNGRIDTSGVGYYLILFNATGQPIEITDIDTFTDFLRFDGRSLDFYHRQANLPNPGFTFTLAGSMNNAWNLTTDGTGLEIVLDPNDPNNLLNQFISATRFTAHVLTTDNFQGSFIGRVLDTPGQGPDINGNALQTMTLEKSLGIQDPIPQFFPDDPLNDFIVQPDLPPEFPFLNFDLAKFEVNVL